MLNFLTKLQLFSILHKFHKTLRFSQNLEVFNKTCRTKALNNKVLLVIVLSTLKYQTSLKNFISNLKNKVPYFIEHNVHTSVVHSEFHNDFWQKKYFYFSIIISQELIIASLFIIKDILNPFSATFPAQCSGNISASFSM